MNLNFKVLLIIFILASPTTSNGCGIRKTVKPGSLIRNGQESYSGQWPWLTSLHRKKQNLEYFCGATLINSKTLVTAAHCISQTLNDRIIAILGRYDISNESETNWVWREIESRIMHEDYKPHDIAHVKSEADIALLIMEHAVEFSDFIQPACLPSSSENVFKVSGVVAGYGQPDPFKPNVKKPLHTGLTSVDLVDCLFAHHHSLQVVSRRSFCAGNKNTALCFGDSGSGFFTRVNNQWTLLGITSHGFDTDCNVDSLVVFVNVPLFVDWIERNQRIEKRVLESKIDPQKFEEPQKFECGHLLPMNVNNNPNSSKTPGFYSGIYKDGSSVYPGTGYFPNCPGTNPARITISNSQKGPGAYIGCNREHLFDGMQPKYFINHPKLKWIKTNTNAEVIKNAVKVFWSESGFDFVARVNLSDGSKIFQQIGYFWNRDLCYWDVSENFMCRTGEFEILACEP